MSDQVNDAMRADTLREMNHGPEMYDFGFWNRKLSSFAQEREIPVLDLAPGFATAIANERLYFENDTHVNERGHVLIAELIQEFLEANELLRGAP